GVCHYMHIYILYNIILSTITSGQHLLLVMDRLSVRYRPYTLHQTSYRHRRSLRPDRPVAIMPDEATTARVPWYAIYRHILARSTVLPPCHGRANVKKH